jgi:hypothetical protein
MIFMVSEESCFQLVRINPSGGGFSHNIFKYDYEEVSN